MKNIPVKDYLTIVKSIPILCVDLVIINNEGKFLLVKRKNQPMKGRWWTIGGRVRKGESMTEAAVRKAKEEIGVKVKLHLPLGFYEEHYKRNPFGVESGVHTTTIMFLATLLDDKIELDETHSDWKWAKNPPSKLSNIQPFNLITKGRELLKDYE